jgi:hypothetical protein
MLDSELTNGKHVGIVFLLRRPSSKQPNARTVLTGKGPLRRAKNRRALRHPARRSVEKQFATGGSGGNTIREPFRFNEPDGLRPKEEALTQTPWPLRYNSFGASREPLISNQLLPMSSD